MYVCVHIQIAISKPHGNHKLKIYNRYTQIKKKELKHDTKVSHQITREEGKRGKEGERPTETNPKQLPKMAIRTRISIITLNINRLTAPKDTDWLNG